MVGEDEDRNLETVGLLESTVGQGKRLLGATGSVDDAGKLPVTGVNGQFQIGLFSPCRHACSRSRPLGDVDNHGRFRYASKADSLFHEGEPSTRSGHHGTGTRIPGANGHVDGGYLVFSLFHGDTEPIVKLGQAGQHCRSGGHWVR